MDDSEEVVRLRARIAELETAQAQGSSAAGAERAPTSHVLRAVAAAVVITLACVLAPLSVTSVWASSVLSDTDRYVETVAPIAQDPGVQSALADQVTAAIMQNLDVEGLTTRALDTLAQVKDMPPRVARALPALAVPLTKGIESFTRTQAGNLMASPQFEKVWAEVNRIAHEQIVKLLEGNEGGAVSAQGDDITLNLKPIIQAVKTRLVDQGFALAGNIPEVDKSFVLVQSDGITKAQRFYVILNNLGAWLPFIALFLFIGGVFLARNRRSALLKGAIGVTVAMVALGLGLTLTRSLYVETTPADILSAGTAGNVFDTLVRFLRTGLRAVAVLGLVVALAAFLTGPSTAAVRTRSAISGGIGSARGGAEAAGWNTGRFGGWVHAQKRALRITTVIAGGLTLMFWDKPTAAVVLGVALLVLLVLAVIEFLARPPEAALAAGPTSLPRQVPRHESVPAEEKVPASTSSGGAADPGE
jgi:hypothetical protein